MKAHKRHILEAVFVLVYLLLVSLSPVGAQDGTGKTITADDVNNVARKLYCPVCENIPLDTCGTAACAQWRDEIRIQLEEGMTPQQVIDNFVNRYGDRVVGTPQDPTLRALSLVTPWVVSVLAAIGAGVFFLRWRRGSPEVERPSLKSSDEASSNGLKPKHSDDEYRARLEQDLAARR